MDDTFLNKPGVLNLTLDLKGKAGNQLEVIDSDEPPAKFRTQSLSKFTDEEAALARKASAEIRLPFAIAPFPHTHVPGGQTNAPTIAEPPVVEALPEPVVSSAGSTAPDLLTDLSRRGLPALFDSNLGVGFLLLAAFLFGAAHAFTPGHGKTLVAAYLIGERGTVRHAVLLAIATTVQHIPARSAAVWLPRRFSGPFTATTFRAERRAPCSSWPAYWLSELACGSCFAA